MKNILRVHLKHIEPNDLEPNVADLTELLPRAGFRPLNDATPENMPAGAVAVIYNCNNHTMFSVMVCEHLIGGFSYIPFGQLNNIEPDMEHMNRRYEFANRLYKVLFQLPVTGSVPHIELLPKAIEEAGFRSLNEATPDDLSEGCVALLFANYCALTPVIVRVLSKQFEGDHRFLYWNASSIVAGNWHSAVIMDKLNSFRNYSYLVIS